MSEPRPTRVVVKRYGDRLYLTTDARYVSAAELLRMVEAGAAVVIVDTETGADVTDAVLGRDASSDRDPAPDLCRWGATVEALAALALDTPPDATEVELDTADEVRRLIALGIGAAGLPPSATSSLPPLWLRRGVARSAETPPSEGEASTQADPEESDHAAPPAPPPLGDRPRRD